MDLVDVVAESVERQVGLGVLPFGAIVRETVDALQDEAGPAIEGLVADATASAFARHASAQSRWPATTDSDRVTRAFRELAGTGIVAREDFSCCQDCALDDLRDEFVEGERARGYAYYHAQDADRAVDGEGLFIAYGGVGASPSQEIGAEVAAVLRQEGLQVDWDGSADSRIAVPMVWARRRTGRLAAVPDPGGDDRVVDVWTDGSWIGPYAPSDGPIAGSHLCGLHLPWLPAGTAVRVEVAGGRPVTIWRDGASLVAEDAAADVVRVGRHHGARVLAWALGEPVAAPLLGSEPGLLEVTYEHATDRAHHDVPLELSESIELLRRMPPRTGSWVSYSGRSGGVLQAVWEDGRLWVETPRPELQVSVGRHVTVSEAEGLITALAEHDHVAIQELDDLETVAWRS